MTIDCKTAGLSIEWHVSKFGGRLYATLMHKSTGTFIRKFTSMPIEGGKRKFAAKVDDCVGHLDWMRSTDELVADMTLRDAVYSIPYNCR